MAEWTVPHRIRLFAPAKINLGLEVCGKRADGFHEIVTLMESISIFDVIDIRPSAGRRVIADERIAEGEDLVARALDLIEEHIGRELCLSVTIRKQIPIAAGLGGGSSDAGTVIEAIGKIAGIPSQERQVIAASLGSDVPFFLHAGVSIATDTGTDIHAIPAAGRRWYIVAVPELDIPQKTAELYGALVPDDYTGGGRTLQIAESIGNGCEPDWQLLHNAFQRPLLQYPEFRQAVDSLVSAGCEPVLASGAGPSLFAVCRSFQHARDLYSLIENATDCHVFMASSVGPEPNKARLRS